RRHAAPVCPHSFPTRRPSDLHVAAAPAIAAIGAAEFEEFLAQEAHRAGPAIARADIDFRLVEKFHVVSLAAAPCRRWSQRARVKDRKSTRLNSSHVKTSYAVF